jgi:Ca2+-binding RTX toxin-like protein
MADGTDLPGWLQFESASGMLSGHPAFNDLYRPIRLKLTATDRGGLSNSTVLTMVAANIGSDADDWLSGSDADDYLLGFGGNDTLIAGSGNDALSGGSGDDLLDGGKGSDTYFFESGWGWDDIQETPTLSDKNVVSFGEGIQPADILLSRTLTSLQIRQCDTYDLIRVSATGDLAPVYQEGLLSEIRFHSGEVWSALSDQDIAFEGMLDSGHTTFNGSRQNDLIWTSWFNSTVAAGDGDDAIFGNSGDDQLSGGSGNDILDGGSGDDVLSGGPGDDLYRVSSWSGYKTIDDLGGEDTLEFSDVANALSLRISRSGQDLLVGFTHASGGVTIKHFFSADGSIQANSPIDWFQFEGGRSISSASLVIAAGLAKSTTPVSVSTSLLTPN